jgi:hypothetical protein
MRAWAIAIMGFLEVELRDTPAWPPSTAAAWHASFVLLRRSEGARMRALGQGCRASTLLFSRNMDVRKQALNPEP